MGDWYEELPSDDLYCDGIAWSEIEKRISELSAEDKARIARGISWQGTARNPQPLPHAPVRRLRGGGLWPGAEPCSDRLLRGADLMFFPTKIRDDAKRGWWVPDRYSVEKQGPLLAGIVCPTTSVRVVTDCTYIFQPDPPRRQGPPVKCW